jgi:type II secretory pathway pseudopilin PulG
MMAIGYHSIPRPLPRGISRSAPRGFTLLEVVLALGLTVMIAGLVTSAAFTAFQTKKTINDEIDIVRNHDVAADTMAQEIRNALPPTQALNAGVTIRLPNAPNSNTGSLIGPFEGTDSAGDDEAILDFFTTGSEPKADLQPDVREVQYALVAGDNGNRNLVRRCITNLLPADDNAPLPPDVILAQNVVDFQVTYNDGTTDYTVWDSTQQNNTLPLIVTFTLTLAPRKPGGDNLVTTRSILLPCGTDTSLTGDGSTTGLGGAL